MKNKDLKSHLKFMGTLISLIQIFKDLKRY